MTHIKQKISISICSSRFL